MEEASGHPPRKGVPSFSGEGSENFDAQENGYRAKGCFIFYLFPVRTSLLFPPPRGRAIPLLRRRGIGKKPILQRFSSNEKNLNAGNAGRGCFAFAFGRKTNTPAGVFVLLFLVLVLCSASIKSLYESFIEPL